MNGLDLFSGIAGLSVALAPWIEPIVYCENDPFCQRVLAARMRDGCIARAPVWGNVQTLRGSWFRGQADIVYGGFPCQDASVAGRGRGLAGERTGLVWHLLRILAESEAPLVFLENVPGIRTRGAETLGKHLASAGFDCRWDIVSAAEVGAPHLRKRWFLFAAHADRLRLRQQSGRKRRPHGPPSPLAAGDGGPCGMADPDRSRRAEWLHRQTRTDEWAPVAGSGWWATEPDVDRVVDGLPAWVDGVGAPAKRGDRLRALGNAVVPQQAREAFMRLSGMETA